MADLVTLGQVIEILRKYTHKLLHLGGADWERRQLRELISSQGRQASHRPQHFYRVLIVATCQVELDVLAETKECLCTPALWLATPPSSRTVKARGRAFRMLSRVLCLVSKQIASNSVYPYKTFRLLADLGMKDVILGDACQWDPWTASFCADYAEQGIDSEVAIADLRCSATMLKVDTSQIESLHATIRRHVEFLGVQTHAESFLDASAESVLRKVRTHRSAVRHRLDTLQPPVHGQGQGEAAPQAIAAETVLRGGGGAWRAFIALNAGTEGADFKHLSELYHNLDDEEKGRLIAVGAEATRLHRSGHQQPFGQTKRQRGRDQQAMLMRNAAVAVLDNGGDQADTSLMLAFANQDKLVVAQQRVAGCGSAWARVLAVRALCTSEERMRAASRRRCAEEVAKFESEGGGVETKDKIGVVFPALADRAGDLQATPAILAEGGVEHYTLTWTPVDAFTKAWEVSSLPARSKISKAVVQRFQTAWHRIRERVSAGPDPLFDAETKAPQLSPCARANMCVCRKSGRQHLLLMEKNLRVALRRAAQTHSCAEDMKEARSVVLFVGRTREQVARAARGALDPASDAEMHYWMHLGHLGLKPWEPFWHEVDDNKEFRLAAALGPGPHDVVVGNCEALTCHQLLARLRRDLRWDCVMFRLVESNALLPSMVPNHQIVQPVVQGEEALYLVWDPWKPRGRKRQRDAWNFDFSIFSEDAAEEEEDELDHDVLDALEKEISGHAMPDDSLPEGESDSEQAGDGAGPAPEEQSLVMTSVRAEGDVAAPPGSSTDPPHVPPVPPPAAEPGRRARGNPDNITLNLPDGNSIVYYAGPQQFYAICRHNHAMGSMCRMTRTRRGQASKPAAGRPLGFLMAWLQAQDEYGTCSDHHDLCEPDLADRRGARALLHTIPAAELLFAKEREVRAALGEGSEPEDCP